MQYDESHAPIPDLQTEDDIPVRRGYPVFAWLAILAMVGFVTYLQNGGRNEPHPLEDSGTSPQDVIMLLQSRYLIGAAELAKNQNAMLYQQATVLNQGTVEQRLRFAVVAEELAGPEQALTLLSELDASIQRGGIELDKQQIALRNALTMLMTDYADDAWDAPSVDQKQRQLLIDKLGWFGDLALAPKQGTNAQARAAVMRSAEQTAISLLGTAGLFCLLLMFGVMALVVFAAAAITGSVRSAITCGRSNHSGIYPETFAVWLVLFFLLTQGASLLVQNERYRTLALAAAMFGSLLALIWPRLRGISWAEIRADIGWTAGRRPLAEPAIGVRQLCDDDSNSVCRISAYGCTHVRGWPGGSDRRRSRRLFAHRFTQPSDHFHCGKCRLAYHFTVVFRSCGRSTGGRGNHVSRRHVSPFARMQSPLGFSGQFPVCRADQLVHFCRDPSARLSRSARLDGDRIGVDVGPRVAGNADSLDDCTRHS